MKLDIPCGQGRLQVTDEGHLQLKTPFGRVKWSMPAKNVGTINSQRKLVSYTITFETPSGAHTVTTISAPNYERLREVIAEYQK